MNKIVLHFTPDIIKEWLGKFIEKAKKDNEQMANIAMLEDIQTLAELGANCLQPMEKPN